MALAAAGGFDEATRVRAHSGELGLRGSARLLLGGRGPARRARRRRHRAVGAVPDDAADLPAPALARVRRDAVPGLQRLALRPLRPGRGSAARRGDPSAPRSRARRRRDPPGGGPSPHRRCAGATQPGDGLEAPQPRGLRPHLARGLRDRPARSASTRCRPTTSRVRSRGCGWRNLGTSDIPVQDQDDFGSDNIFFAQAIGNPVDMMSAVTFMTAGGVLDRFPDLRMVFLEANGGWIVPWLERLDHHYEIYSLGRAVAGPSRRRRSSGVSAGSASTPTSRRCRSRRGPRWWAPTGSCGRRTSRTPTPSTRAPRRCWPRRSPSCPTRTRRGSPAATPRSSTGWTSSVGRVSAVRRRFERVRSRPRLGRAVPANNARIHRVDAGHANPRPLEGVDWHRRMVDATRDPSRVGPFRARPTGGCRASRS